MRSASTAVCHMAGRGFAGEVPWYTRWMVAVVDIERAEPAPATATAPRTAAVAPPRPAAISRRALFALAVLSAALRVRYLFAPINTDEGGFLAIARAWRHGKVLYSDVWVDRPQGLLVVYRLWDMLGGGTHGLRVIAIVFGAVAVVAVARLVALLCTPQAGIVAGLFAAFASSAPVLEGFSANGELLGSTLSAVALLLGCSVVMDRLTPRWMYVAGICGGLAMSMKQSGVDGLAALVAWLLLAIIVGWVPRRLGVRRLGQLLAGALAVVAALVIHGALTGWSAWLYAVNGYRTEQRSVFVGAAWPRFFATAHLARGVLWGLVLAAVIGAAMLILRRHHRRIEPVLFVLPIWLLTATASFFAGGQFFRHYWVIVTFPVAAICGSIVGSLSTRRVRVLLIALALAPAIWSWWGVTSLSRDRISVATGGNDRATRAEHIASWFRGHAAGGDTLYALCARADLYADANTDPPYPYLWFDNVHKVPGAMDELRNLLDSPQRPTYVVEMQTAKDCDATGALGRSLDRYYREVTKIDGISVLQRIGPPTG